MKRPRIPLWLVPMAYAVASIVCGLILPRFERAYFESNTLDLSPASTQAFLSAVASGMMVLTGIVFSITFIMVQFSAIAYSPRLVSWFARDPMLFHSLGIFVATFTYSLSALVWVDRAGSGKVPTFSTLLVAVMLIISVVLFSRLVQSISDLQINNVLQMIGIKGRRVIRGTFESAEASVTMNRSPVAPPWTHDGRSPGPQILRYSGRPLAIASFDTLTLIQQAEEADAVIELTCAVGDTLLDNTMVLRAHGGKKALSENGMLRGLRLENDRTFEQDPKYPIRLLVDIAIKALSPAINDPTTAVQAINQIEDLLHRLGRCNLDASYRTGSDGALRLILPFPSWEDYLSLAFDEIRQYGSTSVQVMRRLRAALLAISESLVSPDRVSTVKRYLKHLDVAIEHSSFDPEDQAMARAEDPQGLGFTRQTGS
jgi:uncharacterized membrane protein